MLGHLYILLFVLKFEYSLYFEFLLLTLQLDFKCRMRITH